MTAVTELERGPTEFGEVAGAVEGKSPRQLFWMRFKRDRAAMVGLCVVVMLILIAAFAGVIADKLVGHGPNELFQREMTDEFGLPLGPNGDFWFGADTAGRDLFVRILYGTRTSLIIAIAATGIAVFIGVVLGLLAGYFRGFWDTIISRTTDIVLALPILLLAIGMAAACGVSAEGCLNGFIEPGTRRLVVFIIAIFSFSAPFLLDAGGKGQDAFIIIGFGILGLSFGQASGVMSSRFEQYYRYTGAALTPDLAWLVGAAFAPLVALGLATNFGIIFIGGYLISGAICTLVVLGVSRALDQAR